MGANFQGAAPGTLNPSGELTAGGEGKDSQEPRPRCQHMVTGTGVVSL